MNGKYPNYQKVGKITRMCVQFVPGSSFLRADHAKSLGTRLMAAVAFDSLVFMFSLCLGGRSPDVYGSRAVCLFVCLSVCLLPAFRIAR